MYVQAIVGTSRSTMPTAVSAAIAIVTMIASTRFGSSAIAIHASSERVPKSPRVENSAIATSGSSR